MKEYDLLNKGLNLVIDTIDLKKLIKHMRLVKFMSQILMTKEQRRFLPYLHDSHLDYNILKG